MKGQKEEVLQFLKNNGTMTPWTAWEYLGITKLATRISELRSDGVAIGSEMVEAGANYVLDAIQSCIDRHEDGCLALEAIILTIDELKK